jgi:hypothetical protein
MNTRRFVLRLAVAFVTFLIGWTAAVLFGASRADGLVAPPAQVRVVFVPFNTSPPPPSLDLAPLPPCGTYRMRHDFEWHEQHMRDFGATPPTPPYVRRLAR